MQVTNHLCQRMRDASRDCLAVAMLHQRALDKLTAALETRPDPRLCSGLIKEAVVAIETASLAGRQADGGGIEGYCFSHGRRPAAGDRGTHAGSLKQT